jgi:hypothetical protein
MPVRTVPVGAKEVLVGDLLAIGKVVMRVTEVRQLHNGVRLWLDTGGLLALPTATRLTVSRAERPRAAYRRRQ